MALLQLPAPPERPEHYCMRAYRNRALNRHRSLWRRLARELESKSWFEPAPGEHPAQVQAMAALARLPREQREVIVLKVWHDYSFQEIGELLELSPNTAAGRYRYGLQRIKRCLKGATYECEPNDSIGSAVALLGAPPPLGGP